MNSRDKNKLLILFILIAYIAITVSFIVGTSHLQWWMIIVCIVGFQYLIIQPKVCKLYYKANKLDAGFGCYIPIWNELMMFKPKDSVISLCSYVLLAFAAIALFIPASFVANVFGEHFALNFGTYVIRFAVIAILINSIAVGVSFSHVHSRIRRMEAEFADNGATIYSSMFIYILMFLPLIRAVGLTAMLNALTRLVQMNNFVTGSRTTNNTLMEE